jgi:hypothetical protein
MPAFDGDGTVSTFAVAAIGAADIPRRFTRGGGDDGLRIRKTIDPV